MTKLIRTDTTLDLSPGRVRLHADNGLQKAEKVTLTISGIEENYDKKKKRKWDSRQSFVDPTSTQRGNVVVMIRSAGMRWLKVG